MLKAAVVGGRGYIGGELLRLLLQHPMVEVTEVTSRSDAGVAVSQAFPHLATDLKFTSFEPEGISADIVFLALPHKVSMEAAARLIKCGKKVIDLSGDFRLNDPLVYEKWYGEKHFDASLLGEAVYGLPEINRDKIKNARLIACPGCYPTSILLGLAPILKFAPDRAAGIIASSVSGISGAGREPQSAFHFPEMNEEMFGYKIFNHRHEPEICQEMEKIAKKRITFTFSPHVGSFTRGIYSSIYIYGTEAVNAAEIRRYYEDFYKDACFVRVEKEGRYPLLKAVRGSNFCNIGVFKGDNGVTAVFSAIDNLIKGGSGQAVQCMNIIAGMDEMDGLKTFPPFP